MRHIAKTESGQFIVVHRSSKNGKVLNDTETFKRKRTAIDNIVAVVNDDNTGMVYVQDDTVQPSVVLKVYGGGDIIPDYGAKPGKPYKPKKQAKKR